LALNYGPSATTLYVDGIAIAQGAGLPSIPPAAGLLVIGSTLAGTNAAGADFDEFFSFNLALTDSDINCYYALTSGQAALGPIRAGEQGGWGQGRGGLAQDSILSSGNVFDPDNASPCSPGGPVFITNIFTTLQTNGNTTVSFDIYGGTNGVFYDLYYTTNLGSTFSSSQWTWMAQVLTCNTYVFSNQPPNAAFYLLAPSAATVVVEWGELGTGEDYETDALTNVIAIAAGDEFSLALFNNGTVIGWGDDSYGQTDIPAGLSNVVAIAAGAFQGVALLANGSVTNWGSYWDTATNYCSVTNTNYVSLPPTSGVVAVAAGMGQELALLSNGTCVAWGFTNVYGTGAAYGTRVPTDLNLTNVSAIACGGQFNVALSSNGTVKAWGLSDPLFGSPTNVPGDLTSNVAAIAAGTEHSMALLSNGTVVAWGYNEDGETNVPSGLSNVVAIAAGGYQSLALQADGTVVAWGDASLTNVPAGLVGVKAISAGFIHSLAIYSDQLSPLIMGQPFSTFSLTGGTFDFLVQAEGFGTLQYQWQFDGVNIFGATNSSLTITNAQTTNQGTYDVVVSTSFGSVTSSNAVFTLVLPPQITSTTPPAPSSNWVNAFITLSVAATAADESEYPLSYQWSLNGTNLSGATLSHFTISQEGNYMVAISNAAGNTNISWDEIFAFPGMVEAWGDDEYGECNRPAWLTNATGIAAGEYQSVAVTDSGTVVQWGEYSDGTSNYSVTNYSVATAPPTSGVVAVAAGLGHALALLTNGSVTNWGLTNDVANTVPTNLQPATTIAAGWYHNIALLTNGAVTGWGSNSNGQTTIPSDLTNANAATAIAAGELFSLALRANGTVEGWGDNTYGQTSVPTNLTGVVAIAAGGQHCLALNSNGMVVAWGDNEYGQTNVPSGMSNVMAIAAGDFHSLALINDGTLVAWGNNSYGQTNLPSGSTNVTVKLIAAGGYHSLAAIFSPVVQYPVDVSKDLLLIYNTNSLDSSNVCQYYLTHRPMVSNANVLGIGDTTNDPTLPSDFTTNFQPKVQMWLSNNPTKRPLYVVLFQNIPQELDLYTNINDTDGGADAPSVQYQLHYTTAPGWYPYVTAINMNGTSGTNFYSSDGTNDCIAYIDKLVSMASNNPPGTLFISASAGGYNNTNWYFDQAGSTLFYNNDYGDAISYYATGAEDGVTNVDPIASVIADIGTNAEGGPIFTTQATNVAGYFTGGWDGGQGSGTYYYDAVSFATNGQVVFSGDSGWYIMTTIDSFDGQRATMQSSYLTWFASNAFGGTNYSNTPIGAVTTVNEPGLSGKPSPTAFYGDWAAGKSFAISAWDAQEQGNGTPGVDAHFFQAVGDPFVRK
jgi:alpha-tubulin suppressor-like RCC1 family protein